MKQMSAMLAGLSMSGLISRVAWAETVRIHSISKILPSKMDVSYNYVLIIWKFWKVEPFRGRIFQNFQMVVFWHLHQHKHAFKKPAIAKSPEKCFNGPKEAKSLKKQYYIKVPHVWCMSKAGRVALDRCTSGPPVQCVCVCVCMGRIDNHHPSVVTHRGARGQACHPYILTAS